MANPENRVAINFWLLAIFFAIVLGGVSLGALYMTRANSIVKAKIAENKEKARPANIDAIVVSDKNCQECFDTAPILANLAKANVKIISTRNLDWASDEAKTLISKYSITKLPTVILTGEVQKNADLKKALSQAGDINGDTFVLRQVGGIYVDVVTGEVKGLTELTLISDSSCSNCYDVNQHPQILARYGVRPKITNLDIKSPEAKLLIKKYQISFIPTFVLTGDVDVYSTLTKIWPQIGTVINGAYILTTAVPSMGVYKDLKTGKIIDPSQTVKQSSATTTNK